MKALLLILLLTITPGIYAGPFDTPEKKVLATMNCPLPPRNVVVEINVFADKTMTLEGNMLSVGMAGLKPEYGSSELYVDGDTKVIAVDAGVFGDDSYVYFDFKKRKIRYSVGHNKWKKGCR